MSIASNPEFSPLDALQGVDMAPFNALQGVDMAFNDPRTIPSGWAPFTDPQTAGRQAGNRRRARSARKAQIHRRPGQEQGCAGGAAGPLFDPFPSPNTIPAGWDLMEME